MGDIVIGSTTYGAVVIGDTSGDGVYQPGESISIRPKRGKALTAGATVQAALRQLGIGPLTDGVRLNPLAQYVQTLRIAEESVRWPENLPHHALLMPMDHPRVEEMIRQARRFAQEAGMAVVEDRILAVYRAAATSALRRAERVAEFGREPYSDGAPDERLIVRPDLVDVHVAVASDFAMRTGTPLAAAQIAAVYRKGLEVALQMADRLGNLDKEFLQNCERARVYAERTGVAADTTRITAFLQRRYERALQEAERAFARDAYAQVRDLLVGGVFIAIAGDIAVDEPRVAGLFQKNADAALDKAEIHLAKGTEAALKEASHYIAMITVNRRTKLPLGHWGVEKRRLAVCQKGYEITKRLGDVPLMCAFAELGNLSDASCRE